MNIAKQRKSINWRTLLFYVLMMAWPVLQFIIFYIVVNANSIILSFKVYNTDGEFVKWGLDNYSALFTEEGSKILSSSGTTVGFNQIKIGMKYSFLAYAVNILFNVPFGLFISYYIAKRMPLSGFFRVLLFLPSIIPVIVLTSIYQKFVAEAMPQLLGNFGIDTFVHGFSVDASPTVKFVTVMFFNNFITGFGTSVLMYSNAMSKVSPEILESAKLDGAKGFREFWHIIMPAVYPTLTVFLVTGIAGLFINQINLYSFYGGYFQTLGVNAKDISTFGYLLYSLSASSLSTTGTFATYRVGSISALGLILTLIAIPLTFLVKFLLEKLGPSDK